MNDALENIKLLVSTIEEMAKTLKAHNDALLELSKKLTKIENRLNDGNIWK